jgi:hypothetical protein
MVLEVFVVTLSAKRLGEVIAKIASSRLVYGTPSVCDFMIRVPRLASLGFYTPELRSELQHL